MIKIELTEKEAKSLVFVWKIYLKNRKYDCKHEGVCLINELFLEIEKQLEVAE